MRQYGFYPPVGGKETVSEDPSGVGLSRECVVTAVGEGYPEVALLHADRGQHRATGLPLIAAVHWPSIVQ